MHLTLTYECNIGTHSTTSINTKLSIISPLCFNMGTGKFCLSAKVYWSSALVHCYIAFLNYNPKFRVTESTQSRAMQVLHLKMVQPPKPSGVRHQWLNMGAPWICHRYLTVGYIVLYRSIVLHYKHNKIRNQCLYT